MSRAIHEPTRPGGSIRLPFAAAVLPFGTMSALPPFDSMSLPRPLHFAGAALDRGDRRPA